MPFQLIYLTAVPYSNDKNKTKPFNELFTYSMFPLDLTEIRLTRNLKKKKQNVLLLPDVFTTAKMIFIFNGPDDEKTETMKIHVKKKMKRKVAL